MTDKSILTLLKELGPEWQQFPSQDNLREAYEYIGVSQVAGAELMTKFMQGVDEDKWKKWMLGSISGFRLSVERTITGRNDIMLATSSEPMLDLMMTAFLVGVGIGAKEEIK